MRKPATLRWTQEKAAAEFDLDPKTLRKRLHSADIKSGDDGRYSTNQIVRAIFGELRHEQIRLTRANADCQEIENQCLRRERIPVDVVNEVNDQAHRAIAAIIKAHHGKVLSMDVINEIFDQLRSVPEQLNWPGVEKIPIEPVS